jgi:hypothetical protein
VIINVFGADLPGFAEKEDYFKILSHLLATCTNQEGEVVPVERKHIDYTISTIGKQDQYAKVYEFLTETAINQDDDGDEQVSDLDTDGKSESGDDDDDDGKDGGGTNTFSKTDKGKGKCKGSHKKGNQSKKCLFTKGGMDGMFGGSPFKLTGNGRATVIDITDQGSKTFGIGGGQTEYSSVQVTKDPSLAVHWVKARVCAWEGDLRQHGVVTRVRKSPLLGFMIKPDEGPEINRWFSAEEVAQMALAFSIDAANTSPAMPTGTNIDDVMDAAKTKLDQVAAALAGKMDRKATPADLQVLAKMESQHNGVDKASFSLVSPGTVVSFIRWASRMTPAVFEQVDIEATKVATLLALELPHTRAGVNMTPEESERRAKEEREKRAKAK